MKTQSVFPREHRNGRRGPGDSKPISCEQNRKKKVLSAKLADLAAELLGTIAHGPGCSSLLPAAADKGYCALHIYW